LINIKSNKELTIGYLSTFPQYVYTTYMYFLLDHKGFPVHCRSNTDVPLRTYVSYCNM